MEAVGWHRDLWRVQAAAARRGRSDVPDMLLFPDVDAKTRGEPRGRRRRQFLHGVAIVESKRWERPLDRTAKGARKGDDEREVPSTQILRYLSRAETLSDRRIQWAILTNGRLWRLYYQGAKSRSEEYLEIDLSRLLDVPGLSDLLSERDESARAHWLRVFALMFGRESFAEKGADNRSFHFIAFDEGQPGSRALPRACRRSSFAVSLGISSGPWMPPTGSDLSRVRSTTFVSSKKPR